MEKENNIDEIVEEFNKEGSNDCILGKYLMRFINKNNLAENIKADREINNWLKQKLQEVEERKVEEMTKMIEDILMNKPDTYKDHKYTSERGLGYGEALNDIIKLLSTK